MTHFRKIWDEQKRRWMLAHKDLPRREAYREFLNAFPDAQDVTETAFYNQRSRIGAAKTHAVHGTTKARPLYSEQIKKGYVRIKIAQPNVWVSKAKWVYMETHPWEDFTERSNYIFLDGNTRNFAPQNIERVPLSVMGIFNLMGGTQKGEPELTKIRVLQAKLRYATTDAGEKLGLTKNIGKQRRVFTEEYNAKVRAYYQRPEVKARIAQNNKRYRQKLKSENPEKYQAKLAQHREYLKTYNRRK